MTTRGIAGPELDISPYVGPRPFSADDRGRFYGREKEANQLLPLVIAERLVVFYAQSGAGKSSLINASLIPELERRNFMVLSGRVSGTPVDKAPTVANIYTYNLLLSLEHDQGRDGQETASLLEKKTLAEYLAGLSLETPALERASAAVGGNGQGSEPELLIDAPPVIGGIHPLALVIDQFEEIFNTNPAAWMQRANFFEQLRDAMRSDRYLWVLLAIREDYIAMLDPYADLLPGRLRARFYMQRMDAEAAKEAIRRPVESIRPFTKDAVDMLAENLSLISTGRDSQGQPIYAPGPTVEPVQLQVVCYQLWRELQNRPGSQITSEDLRALAGSQKLAEYINNALGDFYNQAIQGVREEFPKISERRLREWFSHELITEAETRGGAIQGKETTGSPPNDLPNEVVEAFQRRFLIRAEIRGENVWFELSHDRFVAPILAKNRAWSDQNPFPIEAAAEAYAKTGDASRLLDGRELKAALALLEQHPEEFSVQAKNFVLKSQEVVRSRERVRQYIAVGVLSTLLIIAVAMAILAARFGVQSQSNAVTARANEKLAIAQGSTADAAKLFANTKEAAAITAQIQEGEQRKKAEAKSTEAFSNLQQANAASTQAFTNLQTAQVANTQANVNLVTAVAAQKDAQVANLKSQASRLASLADYFRLSNLRLSLLLANQAVNMESYWETRASLLNSLQLGLRTQVRPQGSSYFTDKRPNSVAFSSDGKLIAYGLETGEVQVKLLNSQQSLPNIPADFKVLDSANTVAFSPDGRLAAVGGSDRNVVLWELATGKLYNVRPFPDTGSYYPIREVAFQPKGTLLAIASDNDTQSGKVFLYDTKDLNSLANAKPDIQDCGAANCLALAWSPDGSRLAAGNAKGDLQVFTTANGKLVNYWRRDQAHSDKLNGLAWYPDNVRLASGGMDQRIAEWDTNSKDADPLAASVRKDTPFIYSLAMSPTGRYLVAGGVSGDVVDAGSLVTVWDADTLQKKNYPDLIGSHRQVVVSVAFSPYGDYFASAGWDIWVKLWKFTPQDPMSVPAWTVPSRGQVAGILALPDSSLSAIDTTAGAATIHSAKFVSGSSWKEQPNPKSLTNLAYRSIAYARVNDRPVLLLGGADGILRAVNPASGQPDSAIVQFPLEVAKNIPLISVAISPDGKRAAAAICPGSSQDCGQVLLVDLSANPAKVEPLKQAKLGTGLVTSLAFNGDGSALAAGTSDGQIFIIDTSAKNADQIATEGLNLVTAKLVVTSLAFSPADSNLLIAGFFDRRIALWEASSHDPIGVFDERMASQPAAFDFVKDSSGATTLIAVSDQGEARQWDISVASWMARACKMAGAQNTFTDAEIAKFFSQTAPPVALCK